MRRALSCAIVFGAGIVLSLVARQAAAQQQEQMRLLAQQIFHEADNNKNDFLNHAEFREALGLLQGSTANLAQAGQLKGSGNNAKNAKNAKGKTTKTANKNTSPKVYTADPDGDEKVTLPEWEAYVITYLTEAGDAYQKAKERYAAARKAAASRNRGRGRRRRR